MKERRGHRRYDVSIPVYVADDTVSWSGTTADISRSGARLETEALVREGEFIYLSVDGQSPDDKVIGWVVRAERPTDEGGWESREIVVAFRRPLPPALTELMDDLDVFHGPLEKAAATA